VTLHNGILPIPAGVTSLILIHWRLRTLLTTSTMHLM